MTEEKMVTLIRGMFLNLNEKITLLEKLFSERSPLLGSGGKEEKGQKEPDKWIDGQDVMQMLHISKRTLATLRKNGTMAYSRIGHKLYYRKHDIDELLQNAYVMYRLSAHGKEEGGK